MNIVSDIPEQIDELAYVDVDIAERFKGRGGWLIGLPTQMQLIRELQKLRAAIHQEAARNANLNRATSKNP